MKSKHQNKPLLSQEEISHNYGQKHENRGLYCPRRKLVTTMVKNRVVTAFFKKWRYCDRSTGGTINTIVNNHRVFTIILTITEGNQSHFWGFLVKVSHNCILSHSCDYSTGGIVKRHFSRIFLKVMTTQREG